jgi:hypothetical protein
MSDLNDMFNGIVFGTILSSADKIGINPVLLGRQASKVLAPLIENFAQQFLGVSAPKDMNELVKDLEIFGKKFGVLGKEFELSYTGDSFKIKSVECPWKEMAKYGKTIGYKACPICVITIMVMATIEAITHSQVFGLKIENNESTCEVKILLEQK